MGGSHMPNENTNCGCRKPRKISKGLMSRVAKFIRDKSVDNICVKSVEEIADEMGLLLPSILMDALEQLNEKGTIIIKNRGEQITDLSTFIYIGDDEVTKLMSNTALLGQELAQTLGDNEAFREYQEKVSEMINLLEYYAQEAQDFQTFKEGVVQQIEAQEHVYHIISKTKLKLDPQ